MVDEIKVIKAKFETIKIIVGDTLTRADLKHEKYLQVLIDAIENAYLNLNDAICDDLLMCQQCTQKRDVLNEYLHLFDDIEIGKIPIDRDEKISKFPETIQQIIDRINTVLVDLK